MCGDAPAMRPHLARALWFYAAAKEKIGKAKEDIPALRARARDVRRLVEGREWPDEDSDEGFMRLVDWMLW